MVTPWGSHMGGEEYEPDARLLEAATSVNGPEETSFAALDEDGAGTLFDYVRYFGVYEDEVPIEAARAALKPYRYGYAFEVVPLAGGKFETSKWYVTGRQAKELTYVMPDNRTLYTTDDGSNGEFSGAP